MAFNGKRSKTSSDEPAERILHGDPEFWVTEIGWDYEWAWCPICWSRPDGWWDDGRPKWTGGAIEAAIPTRLGNELRDIIAACRCAAGDAVNAALHVEYFDRLPPQTVFVTRPMAVLWRRSRSHGPRPTEAARPGSEQYNASMAIQFRRHLAGEITYEQFRENAAALERKHMPTRVQAPTISEIMRSAALMELYYPNPQQQEEEPEHTSGLPYKD